MISRRFPIAVNAPAAEGAPTNRAPYAPCTPITRPKENTSARTITTDPVARMVAWRRTSVK
jgi:hypothetical protein